MVITVCSFSLYSGEKNLVSILILIWKIYSWENINWSHYTCNINGEEIEVYSTNIFLFYFPSFSVCPSPYVKQTCTFINTEQCNTDYWTKCFQLYSL